MPQLDVGAAVPVVVLLAGTSLWGLFSAGLAVLDSGGAGPLVALGGAIPLLVIATLGGRRPWRELRSHPRIYVQLGLLEAANLSLYIAALAIGPVPVVVALHLASPIMLLSLAVLTRKRKMSAVIVAEVLLLAAAIALVSARSGAHVGAGMALIGCGLALASAATVTTLITLVARESRHRDPTVSAGLQLTAAAAFTAPLLTTTTRDCEHMLAELALGAGLLAPGLALYWRAMPRLSAPIAGAVGVNEAIVASGVVAALDRSQISLATALSGLLVAAAIVLDARCFDGNRPAE
ncbi:DMT family transporter [Nocardia pseudovaccinii]|uniref:DMT family transporter n=1 Tax=Nocardia pseudovaccinii TaxID=189540 RepID=UPI000A7E12C9|nr:DMT family transporter [Nocardia pseudovaccinii]